MRDFILILSILGLLGCSERPKPSLDTINNQAKSKLSNPATLTSYPEKDLTQLKEAITLKNARKVKEIFEKNEHELIDPTVYKSMVTTAVKNNDLEMVKILLPPFNWKFSTGAITASSLLMTATLALGAIAIPLGIAGVMVTSASALGIIVTNKVLFKRCIHMPDACLSDAKYPFHVAIELGHFDIVEYFVDSRYSWIFFENDQGQDAIELAESHGHTKIANYLKEEQFSISQIRQIFIFTNYLKDVSKKEKEDEDFFTIRATAFSTISSDEEKEELYQYARDRNNLKSVNQL